MLIDSHCHLDYLSESFKEEGLQQIIERARENDVSVMQTIGVNLKDFPKVIKIAESNKNIFASFGIHPLDAKNYPNIVCKDIIDFTLKEKVISIGETGLDYHYADNHDVQKKVFSEHIEAAIATGLPLIIHSRNADRDMIEILRYYFNTKGKFKAVLHCFTASMDLAYAALDMGMYISISGIVTFKKNGTVADAAVKTPLDSLLIETDSPYLAPAPHRGKSNEPSYVKYVAEKIAELRALDFESVAEKTTENFLRLFEKAKIEK